ncbi:lasso peptide biosynthesis B2 protein [Ancylobacter sp.]|uniref:lasso peptide biosynthesis B2 protein n=1 Tax=Ancylobacter sp. TaxID=1872567 RepID=UPI003BAB9729
MSGARRPATLAARWRRLRWRDRALLAEALLVISLARLALVTLPFRHVVRLAATRPATLTAGDPQAQIIGRTRWAVRAVARRVPFRAMCLEQGLTARVLLRRRGVATTLHYGVAKDRDGRLSAHLWVRAGALDVIGTENADQFTLVATFPPPERAGDTLSGGHAH